MFNHAASNSEVQNLYLVINPYINMNLACDRNSNVLITFIGFKMNVAVYHYTDIRPYHLALH